MSLPSTDFLLICFFKRVYLYLSMNSKLHPDIISLEKRLKAVVELEQYEIAAKIKQWIDELTIYYNNRYEKTNVHVCSN